MQVRRRTGNRLGKAFWLSDAGSERFVRFEGPDPSGPIYFLPWRTRFATACRLGLVATTRWAACYQLPDSIVGHDPRVCASCIRAIADDACNLLRNRIESQLIVGFSMGTVPATVVAKETGIPIWSFASADRGDLMIWTSPKVREIRRQAERHGYCCQDYTAALRHLNPIDCIEEINPDSRFIAGLLDRYVPRARTESLLSKAATKLPSERILKLPIGHFGVLLAGRWLQRRWFNEQRMHHV
jgi:hypothetical protein